MSAHYSSLPPFALTRAAKTVVIAFGVLILLAVVSTLPKSVSTDSSIAATEEWHGNVRASHWEPVNAR